MSPQTQREQRGSPEAQENQAVMNPESTERDALLPRPSRRDSHPKSSTSYGLLILIGPALLAGIIVKAFDIAFLSTSYSRIDIVGIRHIAIWESFVTCVEMATSMSAGPLGAWMYRRFTWHSVFCLEFAFILVGLCILYFSFARISSRPEYSESMLLDKGDSQLPRIDIEGWLLLILAVTIPLISLTLGDNFLSWTHPVEITLLISGPAFICLFILFETKAAVNPIMNMKPVFEPEYLRVLFQVFGVISILNSIVFVIPPYIQVRAFDGPSFEDWALTCVFLGFPVGAILGGYLVKKGSIPVQRIMLANAVLLQFFCLLFALRIIKPESARHAPFLVGFGVCTGIWQSCLLYATLSSTDKQWWPQTLALYYLIETFGGDLGMALMSTITRAVAKSGIRSSLGDSEATERIIASAMQDLGSIRQLPEGTRSLVLAAFENAIHSSFFLPSAMATAVILLAAGMNIWPPKPRYEPSTEDTRSDVGNGAS
ncbi:hypothetical protein ACJ41O_014220 [Fusarium nematophilum]